jgi:hypothetical protein
MTSNLIPVITVAGAFGAAFAGQYFANKFTRKRENEKAMKDSLQHIYSPLVYKIINYLSKESDLADLTPNPHLGEHYIENSQYLDTLIHDDTNALFKEIMEIIGEKLTYAHQDLIMLYENTKNYDDYNYAEYKASLMLPIMTLWSRIELCSTFLSDYLLINRKLNTLSKPVKEKIEGPYFFCQVLLILFNVRQHELALNYAFRSKDLIQLSIGEDLALLKKAESIRKELDHFSINLESFSNIKAEDLESEAYHFLSELIDAMEELEPEIAVTWCNEIDFQLNKEELRTLKFLKSKGIDY